MTASNLNFGTPAAQGRLRVVRELQPLREGLDACRARGHRIALVPTMGNLHAGHMALVRRARECGDIVVATIFVNPFQFAPHEDFDSYPRTFDDDTRLLADNGCDLVFAPDGAVVYPRGPNEITRVSVPELGDVLCGASRPGFFRGVATVVSILFNMVQPHVAVFGAKDYQQLLIIRRMVADLKMRIDIESVATVREADGLAMSSRNGYLSVDERARAPAMYQALCEAREALLSGNLCHDAITTQARSRLSAAGFKPDYVEIRMRDGLTPVEAGAAHADKRWVILAAAQLGAARLIDNIEV